MIKQSIGCIIQARTTSTRFPGKVLKILDHNNNITILEEVIRRVKLCKKIDKIIIATTTNASDTAIETIAKQEHIEIFKGSEHDVLQRYYDAAKHYNLKHIIRITSDCPFIDPDVINNLIDLYFSEDYDYVSNGQNRTYPHGLDCEIFSFDALKKAYDKGCGGYFREHVTTYIWNHPNEFNLGSLELDNGENYSNIRITVDTFSDYSLACIIKHYLKENETSFRCILNLLNKKPYLKYINKDTCKKPKVTGIEQIWYTCFQTLYKIRPSSIIANLIKPKKQYAFIESWVVANLVLSILFLIIGCTENNFKIMVMLSSYGIIRFFEMAITQINIIFFNRSAPGTTIGQIKSPVRSMILLFHTIAESISWFALFFCTIDFWKGNVLQSAHTYLFDSTLIFFNINTDIFSCASTCSWTMYLALTESIWGICNLVIILAMFMSKVPFGVKE